MARESTPIERERVKSDAELFPYEINGAQNHLSSNETIYLKDVVFVWLEERREIEEGKPLVTGHS